MKTKIEKINKEDFEAMKSELNDKYLRLYAEFENYKKRTQKEKEEIRNYTKIETLAAILDVDNDLFIASNKIDKNEGLNLILSKMTLFLKSQGIEAIQNTKYDSDIHEVVSVIDSGKEIIEIASRGYTINGKVIRHPKVILGNVPTNKYSS